MFSGKKKHRCPVAGAEEAGDGATKKAHASMRHGVVWEAQNGAGASKNKRERERKAKNHGNLRVPPLCHPPQEIRPY